MIFTGDEGWSGLLVAVPADVLLVESSPLADQDMLPLHTKVYRADVGCMKGASASVESVFSGVKRLLGDFAATMSPEVLELYVFILSL